MMVVNSKDFFLVTDIHILELFLVPHKKDSLEIVSADATRMRLYKLTKLKLHLYVLSGD